MARELGFRLAEPQIAINLMRLKIIPFVAQGCLCYLLNYYQRHMVTDNLQWHFSLEIVALLSKHRKTCPDVLQCQG